MTSAINPNNIDGAYPVAGQDNNSQGFRDNFTNTKTNFQYAADEITDLQNKAVLKAALTGSTLDNDMGGSTLYNAVTYQMGTTRVALGTVTGSQTINWAAAPYYTLTTSGSVSLAFTNLPAAGTVASWSVQITVSNTAHTLTLPAAVTVGLNGIEGISSQTITFGATGTYQFDFVTNNGGSTITVFDRNRPLNVYTSALQILSATSVPSGGTAGSGLKMSSTTNLGVFFGSGVPTLSAALGSLYLRTDGSSTTTRLYVNANGSTTWTNVVTSA